jgi:CRP-like cAMP-binding protein
MQDMLTLSAGLPEVVFESGDAVVREGDAGGGMWVLVSGSLQVRKGRVLVNRITRPGALVGELSVLLDAPCSATVEATERSLLRRVAQARELMQHSPEVTLQVAVGLAERLDFVTSYLADLKHQYGDAPGLSMVPDVLRELAQRQAPAARPGSARDPGTAEP